MVKPTTTTGISKILVPRLKSNPRNYIPPQEIYDLLQNTDPSDLVWDTIIEREDIEQHLFLYNRDSFWAAAESPCGKGVIYDAITFSGLSQEATAMLSGIIPNNWYGKDNTLCEFLASFTIPTSVTDASDIPTGISEDEIRRGFKSWSESTSTSPSGRHLGHFKAIIQHPVLL